MMNSWKRRNFADYKLVNRTYSPVRKNEKPLEILNDVTGEGLNVDYLIQYLEEKYGQIYHV